MILFDKINVARRQSGAAEGSGAPLEPAPDLLERPHPPRARPQLRGADSQPHGARPQPHRAGPNLMSPPPTASLFVYRYLQRNR